MTNMTPELKALAYLNRVPNSANQQALNSSIYGSKIVDVFKDDVKLTTQLKPSFYKVMGPCTHWETHSSKILSIPNALDDEWVSVLTIVPSKEVTTGGIIQVSYGANGTFTRNDKNSNNWNTWTEYGSGSSKGDKGDKGDSGPKGDKGEGALELVTSKQKFNMNSVQTNTRVDSSTGNTFEASGFATSDFIPINPGATSIIFAKSVNAAGSINFNNLVFYNASKSRIWGGNTGSDDALGRRNVTIPANSSFFKISVQGVYQRVGVFFDTYSDNFTYYNNYDVSANFKSKWAGKKVVGFGDSLIAGSTNSTVTPLALVSSVLGFEPVNRGIGGSTVLSTDTSRTAWLSDGTVATLGAYGEYVSRPASLNDGSGSATGTVQPANTVEITSSMATDARVNTIPTDADAIIIIAGTNGMDESGYRSMLQKIYTRCPSAYVFCCSIPFRFTDTSRTVPTNVEPNNLIIRNLCKEFGAIHIDLKASEGVNQYNFTSNLSDMVHATVAGNNKRARAICAVMSQYEPLTY